VLPYTSGTTGQPKGCMHLHRSINHNAVSGALWGTGTSENVVLAVVPMFHITGMVSVLHSAIYMGATLIIMPRWERELAGRLISHYQVTSWTNIPTMVIDLLASPNFASFDLSSLKYIGGGGAPCLSRGPAPAGAIRPALLRRLWPDRNRRTFAQQSARPSQAAMPGHSLHEHRCA
jgi:acyl-CoA synthetase (AMP-forming)/AMP-acid ligase II